jgi:multicomponent Na+:H+ antiporter subunit F
MNAWLVFATVLLFCLVPCGIVCMRGKVMDRLVALELAQIITILLLLLLAEGFHRAIYDDVALTLAILSFASSLAFIRFLERWL